MKKFLFTLAMILMMMLSRNSFAQSAGYVFPTGTSYLASTVDNGKILASDSVANPAANITVSLPDPSVVGNTWEMSFSTGSGKGIVLNAFAATNILAGQKQLTSITMPSNTNYEYVTLQSDGTNLRLVSATQATSLSNGLSTVAPPTGNSWVYLYSTVYASPLSDNGRSINNYFSGGNATITLPSISLLPNGWSIQVYAGNGNSAAVQPAAVSGGTLLDPTGASVSSFTIKSTGTMIISFDGFSFHVLTNQLIDASTLISPILTPTIVLGAGAFNSNYTALYGVTSLSGTMTTNNTLAVPTGWMIPVYYHSCSDSVVQSGGSINTPLILNCVEIYMPNIGTGTGDRDGLNIDMAINGTTPQTEGEAYYNGTLINIDAYSQLNSGPPTGDIYGVSTQIHMHSGATNYSSLHGAGQWIMAVESGASVVNKFGIEMTLDATDAVQGIGIDAALVFDDYGSTGWTNLIELGLPSGQGGHFPVTALGNIIGSYLGGTTQTGINFGNISFTNCAVQTVDSCMSNNALGINTRNIAGGTFLDVHTGSNDNFLVADGISGNLHNGVLIDILNDASNQVANLEIQAQTIRLTAANGGHILPVGQLELGGLSGAGPSAFYVCSDVNGIAMQQVGKCQP